MNIFASHPVGLPGLAAMMLGFFVFFASLMIARRRGAATPERGQGQRFRSSWSGIALQGLGYFVVSFGPPNIALAPLSPLALAEAVVIAALMAGAIALFATATRAMGKNWALVARTRADHTLVTSGPFAHLRHPIYVAMLLSLVAVSIAFGHGPRLLIAAPVFALGTWIRVSREEALLRAMFAGEYDAYAARVRRFVPGIF